MDMPGHSVAVQTQLLLFLGSFAVGAAAGLLLDCFRTLRALLPHHAAVVFLEDALYVFCCIFMVQCYAWMYAQGVFRWQYAVGACSGLTLYLLTVGAVWMRILQRIRRGMARVHKAAGSVCQTVLCRTAHAVRGALRRILPKKSEKSP